MIKKKMQDALNKQIGEETYSSYLYLSIAAYFDSINLGGISHWLKLHAQEEMFHAMKFYNHIVERGGQVELGHIEEPKRKWENPLNAFTDALAHEEHITGCINKLTDLAIEERDHAGRNLLNWFVDEQVEEEDRFSTVVEKLTMIGDNSAMLLMLDTEMGQRAPGQNPYVKIAAE